MLDLIVSVKDSHRSSYHPLNFICLLSHKCLFSTAYRALLVKLKLWIRLSFDVLHISILSDEQ